MTRAPLAVQEATEAAFRALEGIAVSMGDDFPEARDGRPAYMRRQARRMRQALDALRNELDFYDPPADPEPEAPVWPQ